MKKLIALILLAFSLHSSAQELTPKIALELSRLPLHCIHTEWPNKTSHMSDGAADHVLLPSQLHPSFYGCLDWHSSVHGHWLLLHVLNKYPDLPNHDSIIACLDNSFEAEKIKEEASYFSKYTGSGTYERTYGWAWLLKLDIELMQSKHPKAEQWHHNLQPLTETIVKLWKNYLPRQTYPNRTGVHPNTAFGLAFALDWARAKGDTAFETSILAKAKLFYLNNKNVPAYLEPDGSDFFSPTLEAADLMRRILVQKEFTAWLKRYYNSESLKRICTLPVVSDRTDYQIVHLDGLSLSRAWCMKGIASALPAGNATRKLFEKTSAFFIETTLPNVTSGHYGGDHWLATFAVYALEE